MYEKLEGYINQELTYKKICEITGLKYIGGRAKTCQIEDIERYFKVEKNKTKYLLIEKYETPLEKEDKRKSVYYDDLETIILFILDNSEDFHVLWSITKALKLTNMVNSNYSLGRENIENTSVALEVDRDYIYSFYSIAHGRLKRIFESALKRMQSKGLIDVSECTMVCKKEIDLQYNDLGDPVIGERGRLEYDIEKVYREATLSERQIINEIKSETLALMGFVGTSECFMARQWEAFVKKMNSELKRRLNVDFAYRGYSIVKNVDKIHKIVDEMIKSKSVGDLNNSVVTSLKESSDKKLMENVESRDILINALISKNTKLDLKKLFKQIAEIEKVVEKDILPF